MEWLVLTPIFGLILSKVSQLNDANFKETVDS